MRGAMHFKLVLVMTSMRPSTWAQTQWWISAMLQAVGNKGMICTLRHKGVYTCLCHDRLCIVEALQRNHTLPVTMACTKNPNIANMANLQHRCHRCLPTAQIKIAYAFIMPFSGDHRLGCKVADTMHGMMWQNCSIKLTCRS